MLQEPNNSGSSARLRLKSIAFTKLRRAIAGMRLSLRSNQQTADDHA